MGAPSHKFNPDVYEMTHLRLGQRFKDFRCTGTLIQCTTLCIWKLNRGRFSLRKRLIHVSCSSEREPKNSDLRRGNSNLKQSQEKHSLRNATKPLDEMTILVQCRFSLWTTIVLTAIPN